MQFDFSILIPKVAEELLSNMDDSKCLHCGNFCKPLVKFICFGGNAQLIMQWIKAHPQEAKKIEKEFYDSFYWHFEDTDEEPIMLFPEGE